MASRRLAASTLNWSAFSERVPKNHTANFLALKGKTDNYLRKVNQFPAEPPKLDFAAYKNKVTTPAIIESLQKQYEALKVAYPTENVSSQIDNVEKEQKVAMEKFIEESKKRIVEFEAKIAHWDSVMPYEEMTMEDFNAAHPEQALDTVNNPTLWPHDPELQLDSPEGKAEAEEEAAELREKKAKAWFFK